MDPENESLRITRRALHGVAELLLAGPQHAASGMITLRPLPEGFGTTHTPDLRVEGVAVVAGDLRVDIDGRTAQELADALEIVPGDLSRVYRDGSGVRLDELLRVDTSAAAELSDAYDLGDRALRAFSQEHVPILWPEHFDIGITVDGEQANYGISPGDATVPVPYMYVGPWTPPPSDRFWNQPYGAAKELPDSVEDVVAFFEDGRARLSG